MRLAPRPTRRGMTLLEAMLTIVIVSIIAAIVTPIVASATENYAAAANTRQDVEQAAFAMERIVRVLREIPLDEANPELLGISSLTSDSITLDDNRELRLVGERLVLTDRTGLSGDLCDRMTVFTVELFSTDGLTAVTADDPAAHVLQVTLVMAGLDLRTRVMPRVRMTGGG